MSVRFEASTLFESPVAEAIALSPSFRMAAVERFFRHFPGQRDDQFGLGRAILDFQSWEITSGRIAGEGGSAWWRAVNGMMVLDIAASGKQVLPASSAVAAWRAYTAEESQEALWEAHQRSLHAAIRRCEALVAAEPGAERAFAEIVVDVVDRTALSGAPTHTADLRQLTERYYPACYPVFEDLLPRLENMRMRTAAALLDLHSRPFEDVGLGSSRWP